ncbi:MAG: 16S rRNA (guanine(966)-N(2))-methyltransferase RsmD [Clostridiales bacterium]|jgi:16S rRNA (guanine(966)-N(2))-methyltransferase RsmD|nr:16S rRNA (guanine(966)-N(2))-methyltransferase RsmD [Clostridiales bacterium]
MRIITGIARGTKLVTLEGIHTRPTSEKVKEAIFSAIQFDIHDRIVLDLFGGSGQLALEALSRGAAKAVIVDNDRGAISVIKENAQKTKLMDKCVIVNTDWKDFVKHTKEKFSLVFLDPPYKAGFIDEVLEKIYETGILAEDAIIVCESGIEGVPVSPMVKESRSYKYGRVNINILRF